MSETLSRRVGRLVSGGFHAVLDKAEDLAPEVALNENIREIERAIDEVRSELGKTIAQKHLATKKMGDENAKHTNLSDSIATAINMGRDDLAQAGIGEQMDIEARISALEETIVECISKEQELESFITALQAKHREMVQAVAEFKKAQLSSTTPNAQTGASTLDRISGQVSKSGNAFDRVMARQTGLDLAGSDTAKLASLQELENLSRNNRIAERLAQLKAKQ